MLLPGGGRGPTLNLTQIQVQLSGRWALGQSAAVRKAKVARSHLPRSGLERLGPQGASGRRGMPPLCPDALLQQGAPVWPPQAQSSCCGHSGENSPQNTPVAERMSMGSRSLMSKPRVLKAGFLTILIASQKDCAHACLRFYANWRPSPLLCGAPLLPSPLPPTAFFHRKSNIPHSCSTCQPPGALTMQVK